MPPHQLPGATDPYGLKEDELEVVESVVDNVQETAGAAKVDAAEAHAYDSFWTLKSKMARQLIVMILTPTTWPRTLPSKTGRLTPTTWPRTLPSKMGRLTPTTWRNKATWMSMSEVCGEMIVDKFLCLSSFVLLTSLSLFGRVFAHVHTL
jgi:hypothetical protein